MTEFPAWHDVANSLVRIQAQIDSECDVRLQVYEDGQWAVRWGDSSYDQDHRGYCGASSIEPTSTFEDLIQVAKDLISQAEDHEAQDHD